MSDYSVWSLEFEEIPKSKVECIFDWDNECFTLGEEVGKWKKGKNSLKGCKDLDGVLKDLQEVFEKVVIVGHPRIEGECLDGYLNEADSSVA